MFWAAFSHSKRTALVPCNGNPTSAHGGVSSQILLSILQEHLPTILKPGDIFMQDGAGIHRAAIIQAFLHDLVTQGFYMMV